MFSFGKAPVEGIHSAATQSQVTMLTLDDAIPSDGGPWDCFAAPWIPWTESLLKENMAANACDVWHNTFEAPLTAL